MCGLETYRIQGGNRLQGNVKASGSKNAVLPIMAATILSDEPSILHNVPLLDDVKVMCQILNHYGVKTRWEKKDLHIDPSGIFYAQPPVTLMQKMRGSNLVLGPLLGRFGEAELPFPGGCSIGSRPMNYHVQSLCQMGAHAEEKNGFITARAKRLQGSEICLDFPSVGATENSIMAAIKARGRTLIRNAAREPEIVDLARYLNVIGANVKGAGSDCIEIEGVRKLKGAEYSIMYDRIEAGSFLLAGAITGGEVFVEGANEDALASLLAKMQQAGLHVESSAAGVGVKSGNNRMKAVDIKTMPYPGFATDLQSQFMALMTLACGTAIIAENIFENRFQHADEMRRMGANIKIIGRAAVVNGVKKLYGNTVQASDLRAGAALVLTGLAAEGETVVENIEYIDRGYESFEEKLQSLGAHIERVAQIAEK